MLKVGANRVNLTHGIQNIVSDLRFGIWNLPALLNLLVRIGGIIRINDLYN